VTALFVVTIVIGFLEVASTLAIYSVLRCGDRQGPPFRLMVQAVGLLAAGIGGLAMTVTRDVPADGFGEVEFVDKAGNRVRLPAKSSTSVAVATSTRVYITAVDDEFAYIASARQI
jgi:hypothetical protein